jgi:hypothetical protein
VYNLQLKQLSHLWLVSSQRNWPSVYRLFPSLEQNPGIHSLETGITPWIITEDEELCQRDKRRFSKVRWHAWILVRTVLKIVEEPYNYIWAVFMDMQNNKPMYRPKFCKSILWPTLIMLLYARSPVIALGCVHFRRIFTPLFIFLSRFVYASVLRLLINFGKY